MALSDARERMRGLTVSPSRLQEFGIQVSQNGIGRSALDLLAMPNVGFENLTEVWPELLELSAEAVEQVEIDALYAGYLGRQDADIAAFRRDEALALPSELDYRKIGGLSTEVCEKLARIQPATLGAASRISGVTPAAIVAILRHVKRRSANLGA